MVIYIYIPVVVVYIPVVVVVVVVVVESWNFCSKTSVEAVDII